MQSEVVHVDTLLGMQLRFVRSHSDRMQLRFVRSHSDRMQLRFVRSHSDRTQLVFTPAPWPSELNQWSSHLRRGHQSSQQLEERLR